MRFKKWLDEKFEVPMAKKEKFKKLNPKTNRMKTSRKTRYLQTDIPPKNRNFDNIPKYADNSSKVRFQDWLEIDTSRSKGKNWGWSKNGSAVGWSHRAICGFKKGDKVKMDTIGNYKGKEFTIKTDAEAENMARNFAKEVS